MPDRVYFRLIIWCKLKNLKLKCQNDIEQKQKFQMSF